MISLIFSTLRTRIRILSMLSFSLLAAPFVGFALVGELAIGTIMIVAAATSSKVLAVAAQFASAALDPRVFFGQGYLSSTIVQVGWGFVLSFTNAFFIFILLIIGFATIFRYGGYTMKETLGKLVIAALLINFSLVIAGLFIDGSNLLAEYLIQASGNKDFGGSIVNQLGLTPGGQPDTRASSFILSNIIPPTWAAIQGLLIQTVFNLVAAFILALIGIMFVVRSVAIWILLILSPIVWLAWVLPATKTHWDRWWDEFLKWCFFAPIATFFLFLAMTVGTGVNTVLRSNPPDALTPAYFTSTGIINFLVMLGLMIYSLTMAQKHAGVGGDMVKSLAGWGTGFIKGAGMKFSGANMVGRYGKAIKNQFGGSEKEKQAIANARVKHVKETAIGKLDNVGAGNLLRSPKEALKHRAEKVEGNASSLAEGFQKGKYSLDELRAKAGGWRRFSPLARNRDTAAAHALALAQLEKKTRKVEVTKYRESDGKNNVTGETWKKGDAYTVMEDQPAIVKLTNEDKERASRINKKLSRMKGEKSDEEKLTELQIKVAKQKIKEEEAAGKKGGEKEKEGGGDKKEGDKE